MAEQFANNATTTLQVTINASATSISVAAATAFPASAQYRIVIDSEIMLVTAGAGTTTWTVTRGAEGTTAAGHSAGATITEVLTAGAIAQLKLDIYSTQATIGTYAGLPGSPSTGQFYLTTDGVYELRYNGATWDAFYLEPVTIPPTVASLTWVNQGTALGSNVGGTLKITDTGTAGNNIRMLVQAAPGSTPFSMAVKFGDLTDPANNTTIGIGCRDSVSGKIVLWGYSYAGGVWNLTMIQYTNATTFSSTPYTSAAQIPPAAYRWLRIRDDSTNRNYEVSPDGVNWRTVTTELRTNFITANQYGIGMNSTGTNVIGMSVESFKLG